MWHKVVCIVIRNSELGTTNTLHVNKEDYLPNMGSCLPLCLVHSQANSLTQDNTGDLAYH